jgi:YbbR domain-containing protein
MSAVRNLRPGVLVLAIAIAVFLWGVAHGASSVERAYDIPVVLQGLKDKFVVTDTSVAEVNIRVRGSRASLRNIDADDLAYRLDLSGGKKGVSEFEIEASIVDAEMPRGATVVSRSPSQIEVTIERRGRKAVGVRADIDGEPAAGYTVAGWSVEPPRVWLEGARSQVMRLSEVVTEAIDISGRDGNVEREVRLFLGSPNVWMEEKSPVKVVIRIAPDPEVPAEPEPQAEGTTESAEEAG